MLFRSFLSETFKSDAFSFVNENFINGKSAGKLLAIPVLALSYFIVNKTVGSESNFQKTIQSFYNLPEDIRKTANKKLLTYFFIIFAVFLIICFSL